MQDIFEVISIAMRYWFIIVVALMLGVLCFVSFAEYKERRRSLGMAERFIGFLEVINGVRASRGVRIGLTSENMIGSSKNCDVVIEEQSVNKNHATLFLREGCVFLSPVEGAPTAINGRKAIRTHKLSSGDTIRLGNVELVLFLKEKVDA